MYLKLTGDAELTALVGTRIHAMRAPKSSTLPRVVFNVIDEPRRPHMTGASGLVVPRFQIDVYASSSPGAHAVKEAIRNLLDGFSGTLTGVVVKRVFLDNTEDSYEKTHEEDPEPVYRIRMDFLVWYVESIPTG